MIVQARMGSTRLPEKVMKPVLEKPMLAHQIDRLLRCTAIHQLVVATTYSSAEQPIIDLVAGYPDVEIFRGSEHDVLERYFRAGEAHEAEVVVRVTSDCPLIDPKVIDHCVRAFLEGAGTTDYVSNTVPRTFPRGLDTEVFSFEALKVAYLEAEAEPDREHVTPFIWRQPHRFRIKSVQDAENHSDLRWTVDTQEDLELVRRIYGALYPERPAFSYRDALALIDRHPEWAKLNQHIEQKVYGQ